MTTGVPEGANDAVASAYRDERRKRRITRHIGANLGQGGGGTERRRRAPKHLCDLRLEALHGSIVLDGLEPDFFAHVGGLAINVVQQAFDDCAVIGQDCHSILQVLKAVLAGLNSRPSRFVQGSALRLRGWSSA